MPDSAMLPVQTALYGVLAADATLAGLVDGVFDAIPEENKPGRYVVLGESTELADNTFGAQGRDELLPIHVYTAATPRAEGWAQAKAIASRVVALLDGASLAVSGETFVLCQFETSQTLREGDWRHIATDFRILTEG